MAELLGVDADELLNLANKFDPELEEIIKSEPIALPDLLRTVKGMSTDELRQLTAQIKKQKNND
jgi:hypothetical protein